MRDRDRLRSEHLQRLGWRFHRIWSTNWFRDPQSEVAKLQQAYDEAVSATILPKPEAAAGVAAEAAAGAATEATEESAQPRPEQAAQPGATTTPPEQGGAASAGQVPAEPAQEAAIADAIAAPTTAADINAPLDRAQIGPSRAHRPPALPPGS